MTEPQANRNEISARLHRRELPRERYLGLLLGTAIGDSIGLPYEGLSPRRARRLFKPPLRQRLIFGRGMASDDTEHACMTAQALLSSAGEPDRFARSLAWRLRGWLIALPAGIGLATLRAILKLWIGFPHHRSGVYSAGNGPAMRSPVIGLYASHDISRMRALVRVSTLLTHTDPAAEEGALAVALAAAYGAVRIPSEIHPPEFFELLRANLVSQELLSLLERACDAAVERSDAGTLAATLGLSRGVTGYINHTVPLAVFCFLRHPGDYRTAIEQVVSLGGDMDTVAAIVGALVGVTAGPAAIPSDWSSRFCEFPRSGRWIKRLAERLAAPAPARPVPLAWPLIPLRNLLFLTVVLAHGLRRLLPPY